ncbi:hypothetical protein [Granulicella sibirica]|uniref:hypothetical protein n=1 Tax=Granulicella sibirica TaxID=2479048 RepID=UPI001009030D|nr:hypothetical protein [Granulicella sibirica]
MARSTPETGLDLPQQAIVLAAAVEITSGCGFVPGFPQLAGKNPAFTLHPVEFRSREEENPQ